MRRYLLTAAIALAACGAEQEPVASFDVVIPWQLPLTCGAKDSMGPRLVARLEIGGHPDCTLTRSDSTSLSVEGKCEQITANTTRPVMLVYEQELAGFPTLPIAYWITYVRLCQDDLPENGSSDVPLVFDQVNGAIVYTNEQVAELPEASNEGPSCTDGLDVAKGWAKGIIAESSRDLDYDCDGVSNLEEACAGDTDTLFTTNLSACN